MVSCIVNSTVTFWVNHRWISTIVQKMLQAAVIKRRHKMQRVLRIAAFNSGAFQHKCFPTNKLSQFTECDALITLVTVRCRRGRKKNKTKQKNTLTSMTPLPHPHHSDGFQKNDDQLWKEQEINTLIFTFSRLTEHVWDFFFFVASGVSERTKSERESERCFPTCWRLGRLQSSAEEYSLSGQARWPQRQRSPGSQCTGTSH